MYGYILGYVRLYRTRSNCIFLRHMRSPFVVFLSEMQRTPLKLCVRLIDNYLPSADNRDRYQLDPLNCGYFRIDSNTEVLYPVEAGRGGVDAVQLIRDAFSGTEALARRGGGELRTYRSDRRSLLWRRLSARAQGLTR